MDLELCDGPLQVGSAGSGGTQLAGGPCGATSASDVVRWRLTAVHFCSFVAILCCCLLVVVGVGCRLGCCFLVVGSCLLVVGCWLSSSLLFLLLFVTLSLRAL